jgi:hypothetical protein
VAVRLNGPLLAEAGRLAEEATTAPAIRAALLNLVRKQRARRILDFVGSGAWEGDLAEMRCDGPPG